MLPVIGIMWCINGADILEETIADAKKHVDALLFADDGSIDNSLDIAKAANLEYVTQRGQEGNNPNEYARPLWRRQHLLDKAVEMYGREIYVQVIEHDIMILDTDVKKLVRTNEIAYNWIMINCCQKNLWPEELDNLYPNWGKSIKEIMPDGYVDEVYPVTFRPLERVRFDPLTISQWPIGLEHHGFKYVNPYCLKRIDNPYVDSYSPLLAHYGYRGTKFFKKNMLEKGCDIAKKGIDLSSRESILKTARAFNYPTVTGRVVVSPLTRENLRSQFFND